MKLNTAEKPTILDKARVRLAITVLEELRQKGVKEGWPEERYVGDALMDGVRPDQDTLEMRAWRQTDLQGEGTPGSCNTVACMAGWLVLDPRIKALGLHPKSNSNLAPEYEHTMGYVALGRFFGLSFDMITEIFGAHNPSDLAAGIERLKAVLE